MILDRFILGMLMIDTLKSWQSSLKKLARHTDGDLTKLYEGFPALKDLVRSNFYFGVFRGLMELSVSAKLYMNLPEIGILSMLTGISFNVPGDYCGEVSGTEFVNSRVRVISPTYKVMDAKDKYCQFLESDEAQARISVEDYLRQHYFETDSEFTEKYLQRVGEINQIIQAEKNHDKKAEGIGDLLFGKRSPFPEKDSNLVDLLKELSVIETEPIDRSLREFYGQISAIPAGIPTSGRLWTRGRYVDLVRNFCSVAKNGYYEEMDEELRIIREAEQTIKEVKEGKKLRKEDYADLDRIAKEYHAFLMTAQISFHEGEENLGRIARILDAVKKGLNIEPSSKNYLQTFIGEYMQFLMTSKDYFTGSELNSVESKLALATSFMVECVEFKHRNPDESISMFTTYISALRKVDASMGKETIESKIRSIRTLLGKIQKEEISTGTDLDELFTYMDSRELAMKKAGVSEKKVYCSLGEARKRFIDGQLTDHIRDMTDEEIKAVVNLCFDEAERATKYEIGMQVALFGLLGVSMISPVLAESKIANAFSWGLPTAARSFLDSYYNTKGGRVMTAAMNHIFVRRFERQGINVEAALSELDSKMSQAYDWGYVTAMGLSLVPAYCASSLNNSLPLVLPIGASFISFGLAYQSWFKAVRSLKSQIYEAAQR